MSQRQRAEWMGLKASLGLFTPIFGEPCGSLSFELFVCRSIELKQPKICHSPNTYRHQCTLNPAFIFLVHFRLIVTMTKLRQGWFL